MPDKGACAIQPGEKYGFNDYRPVVGNLRLGFMDFPDSVCVSVINDSRAAAAEHYVGM